MKEFREADVWWLSVSEGVIPNDPYGIVAEEHRRPGLRRAGRSLLRPEPDDAPDQQDHRAGRRGLWLASGQADRRRQLVRQPTGRHRGRDRRAGGGRTVHPRRDADRRQPCWPSWTARSRFTQVLEDSLAELGRDGERHFAQDREPAGEPCCWSKPADELGLEGFEAYAFTETGQDLTAYLTNEFWQKGALSDNEISTLLKDGLQFADIAAYVFDLAMNSSPTSSSARWSIRRRAGRHRLEGRGLFRRGGRHHRLVHRRLTSCPCWAASSARPSATSSARSSSRAWTSSSAARCPTSSTRTRWART